MVTIETYAAGGEILTGTFTLAPLAAYAVLLTLDPDRGTVVTVNGKQIPLTYTALKSITDGDKVEIFA